MTSAKLLIVFGIVVLSANFKLLVSRERLSPGLQITLLIESKESLVQLHVLPPILCTYKQVSYRAQFLGLCFFSSPEPKAHR